MYRNTKFLEVLHKIRQDISEEFEFDLMRLTKSFRDESKTGSQTEILHDTKQKNAAKEDLAGIYGNRI